MMELIQPSDWSDVTFNQYKKLLNLAMSGGDDIVTLRMEQMKIFNPDYSVEDLMKLRQSQVIEYFKGIEFIDKEPIKEEFKEFWIDDRKFELINFQDMSMAQWIDSEKFGVDLMSHHKLIAIFYINPADYNDIIRDKVADYIDNLPAGKIFYLVSQFFFIQTALEWALKDYSVKVEGDMKWVQRIISRTKLVEKWMERGRKLFGFKSYTT